MVIRTPEPTDRAALHGFFRLLIEDTYRKEGINHLVDDLEEEIRYKKSLLQRQGKERFFLLVERDTQIIGTIEYGPASELIMELTNGAYRGIPEVGTVFVHPDHQGRGVGSLVVNAMLLILLGRGFETFCLDSGYARAQAVWKKRFGDPDHRFTDYWGEGMDHLIWKRSVRDQIVF
ncbi:GNAT family N-acetyltransferase [Rossellomorea marisflavi]|nr:GNAT family acetyltransferase [Rossellomorea marisflavi]KML04145.1 GNAT family acetyltransferase [Rossellomorea marisflavi]KML29913.1 GNAT family acetyltransferase [Rossellomorea marisflavi]QHA38321.1 GNAT family N-acetyltransferase [Rossellomorea marisflavi]